MIDTRSRVASGDEGKPRGLFDETWLCGASLGRWDSRVASRRGGRINKQGPAKGEGAA
jgi:hypothetical protein